MTPIESRTDERLATLVGVTIDVIERLALEVDQNPDLILAESLFISLQNIKDSGASETMDKLRCTYPILDQTIN